MVLVALVVFCASEIINASTALRKSIILIVYTYACASPYRSNDYTGPGSTLSQKE
jgi:hypothetical protein